MEIISLLDQKKRYSLDMDVYPYLQDHHVEGKVVLSAVEILIILARVVKINFPQVNIHYLRTARFSHYLSIPPDVRSMTVFVDIGTSADGFVAASLLTIIKSKTSTIKRTVEHARVEFDVADYVPSFAPLFHDIKKLEGNCISVPSTAIYRDLVTFGTAYRNVIGELSLSREGALAYISGGNYEADEDVLGSPFPLDAAMHAACVWGQRFNNIVSFPVGFEKRVIYQKTKKGETYLGRVVPVNVHQESITFDALIYDSNDNICEIIKGIKMWDLTQGRLRPPDWIKA